jgi:hypothetical protein
VLAEGLEGLVVWQSRGFGVVLRDGGRRVGDVLARVAVLGGRLVAGAGEERAAEPVDLGAVVVELVLA